MTRMTLPYPPAPKTATSDELACRFFAQVHGQTFVGATPEDVMFLIDVYEEGRDLPASSYIVNDMFEGVA